MILHELNFIWASHMIFPRVKFNFRKFRFDSLVIFYLPKLNFICTSGILLPQVISRFREINSTFPRYILFAQEILYLCEWNWQGFSVSVSLASSSLRWYDVMAGASILRVYAYLEDMGVPLACVQRMWVTRYLDFYSSITRLRYKLRSGF